MTTLNSISRIGRNVALMLMLGVSAVTLVACAGDRAYQDPGTMTRMDFPFVG